MLRRAYRANGALQCPYRLHDGTQTKHTAQDGKGQYIVTLFVSLHVLHFSLERTRSASSEQCLPTTCRVYFATSLRYADLHDLSAPPSAFEDMLHAPRSRREIAAPPSDGKILANSCKTRQAAQPGRLAGALGTIKVRQDMNDLGPGTCRLGREGIISEWWDVPPFRRLHGTG